MAINVQDIITKTDSPERVYDLFLGLGYQKDKLLDPSYKRKIDEFEFAKEEREKVKDIYTVFNYDGKLQIFLIEAKSLSVPFVRYLTKRFSDKYLRFLLILTTDYREYSIVFPEFERIEEGRHKLKLTRLNFDRTQPYHTDLLTISNIALTGDEENWRDIWRKWKDAFSVEKVTNRFFEDYKNAFFELRKTFEKQKIPVKQSHELSQQVLNRLMFLYFISKKRWLNDDPKFIKWYWERYKQELRIKNEESGIKEDTFYEKWLKILFLEAFNNKYSHPHHHPQDIEKILAAAPYLNGGLFHRNELDELPFSITDSLFETVFSFFEKYNFTIREELPLDVEVAVDPQMIGYVYESLSNVAEEIYERQDLGIFYTPTVEVDFMCRRTVVEHLSNHLTELSREWIYRLLFDENKKAVAEHISKLKLWYRIEEVLDNLAVVDPACGSGAFLVGMLHVLAELYRLIYSYINREMTEFELKKKIIGNSLYGVDVMPWAVHSAELRLWLQLIIEEDIPYEQRKLFPLLPNLNMKLRVGDSLVQEVGGVSLHVRDSKLSSTIKRRLTSLKAEKEKYYNNDPTAKFKSGEALQQEELRIFGEILDDKIVSLQKNVQELDGEKQKLQMNMFGEGAKEEKQKSLFEEQIKAAKQDIEHLRETKRKIQAPGQKPFVWDIDFAEIFGDKGGFDIVIGNPPYVRQEKIAPPNKLKAEVTLEGKREYKDKLLSSIQVHYPFVKKLDKKSDYYIYFYFHGLSLLNEKGIFSFITSNSWLDVGYGKDLQEFLLKYCHVKAIYDNEVRRSFKHADVNTIIALFGPPDVRKATAWPALKEVLRFVAFKRPFEEAVNTRNLLAIEKADSIHKSESYRVYPVKQETLLEEGWEKEEELEITNEELGIEGAEEKEKIATPSARNDKPRTVIERSKATKQSQSLYKEKFITGKYEGNKWGGKYLKAPDIFYEIKLSNFPLIPLGAEAYWKFGRGRRTGCDEFFYLEKKDLKQWEIESKYLKPLIKSPTDFISCGPATSQVARNWYVFLCHGSKESLKGTRALEYIRYGESEGFNKRNLQAAGGNWYDLGKQKTADIILPIAFNDRFFVVVNDAGSEVHQRFATLILTESEKNLLDPLMAILNSAIVVLMAEVFGRRGLGQGALDFPPEDWKFVLIPDVRLIEKTHRDGLSKLWHSLSKKVPRKFSETIQDNTHRDIDLLLLKILGLKEDLLPRLYEDVTSLINNRLKKAGSV